MDGPACKKIWRGPGDDLRSLVPAKARFMGPSSTIAAGQKENHPGGRYGNVLRAECGKRGRDQVGAGGISETVAAGGRLCFLQITAERALTEAGKRICAGLRLRIVVAEIAHHARFVRLV